MKSSITSTIAFVLCAAPAFAQTVVEVEPNSTKAEATLATGLAAGGTLNGTSTGATATAGDTALTSADTFRVRTGALPLGIYRHALTLSSTANSASIRGRSQANGVVNGTSDSTFQASSAGANAWYGFGKQEEVYYRVTGTTAATAPYVATLATTPVTPIVVPGFVLPGAVTVTTAGQGHTSDTEIYVYDANLNPIAGGHNDDLTGGIAGPSTVNLTLAAGTYYAAVSNYNTSTDASDLSASEAFDDGIVLDFPDVIANDSTSTTTNVTFAVVDAIGPKQVVATHSAAFNVVWATFTVGFDPNPPSNDSCATPRVITNGSFGGYTGSATNDATASCDPGGAASRDLWFSYTNASANALILTANTCGSSIDTVLTAYASCGGAELACNDTCSGGACGGPSSCLQTPIAAGQTILLRVSDKGGAPGVFKLNVNAGPAGDDCGAPIVVAGPGTYPFDTTNATSGQSVAGACGGPPNKNLWFSYAATTSGSLTASTCGLVTGGTSQDTEISVYLGAGCPTVAPVACNDDAGTACGANGANSIVTVPVTCGAVYTIEVGNFSTTTTVNIVGSVSITETGPTCATPVTYYCPGDGTGATACPCANSGTTGNGCANSVNANGANLAASGLASLAADTWLLSASGVPNGPGLYFQGTVQLNSGNGVAFGDGLRCVGGSVIRLGIVTGVSNASTYPSPNPPAVNAIPISIKGLIAAGDVRNYQLWYRDSGAFCTAAVFNLTNAVNVTWAP